MLLMAQDGVLSPMPDAAIFADTQWEPPSVYATLEWLQRECNIPISVVSKGDIREDALSGRRFASMPVFTKNLDGKKGMLRRQCTGEYKINPIQQEVRRLCGIKPHKWFKGQVEMWIGISMDEVERMKDNRTKWITNRWPLIEAKLTRRDCLEWLKERGYPKPTKSACIGCPFHDDGTWRVMKEQEPDQFADAVDFDQRVRHISKLDSEVFLHRSLQPLDEVEFGDANPRTFVQECEGMCGL